MRTIECLFHFRNNNHIDDVGQLTWKGKELQKVGLKSRIQSSIENKTNLKKRNELKISKVKDSKREIFEGSLKQILNSSK